MTVESIVIYTSLMMGFVTLRARRLTVINFHVRPRSGRWMSSNADCMHFSDPREYVSISDSSCQGMGDDGLNVHGNFFPVTQVIDSSTIIVENAKRGAPLDFGVGTNL